MELACLEIRKNVPARDGYKYPVVVCEAVGKPFPKTRDGLVFPHFARVRIKELDRLPGGRFAATLKGTARKRLSVGSVIIDGREPVYRSRIGYGVSRRPIPPGRYTIRGGLFREHRLPGTVGVTPAGSGYRLLASADLPLFPGGRYRLQPAEDGKAAGRDEARKPDGHAGRAIPFELVVCFPWELPAEAQKRLPELFARLVNELSIKRIEAANLCLLGWVGLRAHSAKSEVVSAVKALAVPGISFDAGALVELSSLGKVRFLATRESFDELAKNVEKEVLRSAGAKADAIAERIHCPLALVEELLVQLAREGRTVRVEGIAEPAGRNAGLSPMERGVLDSLRSRGEEAGFVRAGKGSESDILQKLVRLRVAVRLGDRYCASETYQTLARRLLSGRNPGEAIGVAEARDILRLPREQVVQFLESLDEKGALKREGRIHRVVQGLVAERIL